ncbi:hypothetical protein [Archangium primigenium]|uniref:hypothetical protein n=1 Tax=[Archangium] primigenium TaxID=2792470 RepID=UPI00195C34ED|nr:hypothetical protein [Archangium primigenium]MBM7117022.1 hypothetical protein [Archangium primigenium]
MCIVTWVVSGQDFAAYAFLERFPKLKRKLEAEDDVWSRGDPVGTKRQRVDGGFSLTIFDEDTTEGAVAEARRVLLALEPVRAALEGQEVQSVLRIGLYVGTQKSFVPVLNLSREDLQFFAQAGVSVTVLGYPTSEDEDEDKAE